MLQLATKTIQESHGYLGLLSSILGYWLPSPVQDEDRVERYYKGSSKEEI